MNPLSVLYGVVSGARNALYEQGVLIPHRLKGPVVSVGNLSVGGSGKTPFVILLGELLKAHGIPFDVLSRGYGRRTSGVRLVEPAGSAAEFGDEPMLIARRLEVPVVVGESRYQAGLFAERKWGPCVHLLDDGFQHRGLHRDFDIVLVSSADANDLLLPQGRLREPWNALRRADAIVLTNESHHKISLPAAKPVFHVRRALSLTSAPSHPIVFCGIARPSIFVEQLRALGVEPAGQLFFADHHAYRDADVQRLVQLMQANDSDGFITTEKDIINLGPHQSKLSNLAIAKVVMEWPDSAIQLGFLLERLNIVTGHEKI